MIKTYKYLESVHGKLHEFVIAFFNRIEFETGAFNEAFFEAEFVEIVKRHPAIIRRRCEEIYNIIRSWPQPRRTALCDQIRDSNEIENICRGHYAPPKLDRNAPTELAKLREFFIDLYKQILDGDGFRDKFNTTLREHFDKFSNLNEDVTLCPICGIGELKKSEDDVRDQYDHFLPIALYPFSSVNFKNLVPSCGGCNGFEGKGETDTIAAISTGKCFYPFDQSHKGIEMNVNILRDAPNIRDIEWQITYSNPENKSEEIRSWENIYKIKSRHLGFIKARIKKWYRCYWTEINLKKMEELTLEEKTNEYIESLKRREALGLCFVERPALEGFLNESTLAKAAIEMKQYS